MSLQTFALQFAFLFAPLIHHQMIEVEPGLYRGTDPKIKDLPKLQQQGFKTIVSFRTNDQPKKSLRASQLGIRWVNIPTGVFLNPTDQEFDDFRAVINDPKNLPCLMTCEVNMDRTLVYLAAHQMVDKGWTAAQIDREFKEAHQKVWWPPFRKYRETVADYAAKRRTPNSIASTQDPSQGQR